MMDALHNKAMSLISLKRYTEAEKTLHTVLTLSPALASAQRHLANVGSHWLRPVQSKRYRLEPWGPAHVSYLRACFGHRAFIRLYNRHLSLLGSDKDLAEKIKASAGAHPLDTKAVNWVIVDRATSEPLGLAALVEIDFAHRRAEFLLGMPEPEKAAWGAGLEVALLVMHFAFRTASLNKLVSIVYAHNRAAQDNTMELGFSQEGYLRAELWNADTGSYQDIYRNGMTQDQFFGQARLKKLTRRLLGMN
jgi:diamine N-acetyltransferase